MVADLATPMVASVAAASVAEWLRLPAAAAAVATGLWHTTAAHRARRNDCTPLAPPCALWFVRLASLAALMHVDFVIVACVAYALS